MEKFFGALPGPVRVVFGCVLFAAGLALVVPAFLEDPLWMLHGYFPNF